jgi:hypothetical protein
VSRSRWGCQCAEWTPAARRLSFDQHGQIDYVYGAGKGKWKGTERALEVVLPDELLDAFGLST